MIDIFQNNNFFEFSPPRGPQTTEKCASHPRMMNRNGNKYHDYCDIRWFYDPSFVWKRCYNFKRSQSEFLIIFQNHPLKQFYRDYQFCHFSTAKNPSWYMAFVLQMLFQRKSNPSSFNLWNKILGQFKRQVLRTENINGTCVKFTTFELAVVMTNTRVKLDSSLNSSRIWSFSTSSKTKQTIIDFIVAIIRKEQHFYCAKLSCKHLDNTSRTCVFVYFEAWRLVPVIIAIFYK